MKRALFVCLMALATAAQAEDFLSQVRYEKGPHRGGWSATCQVSTEPIDASVTATRYRFFCPDRDRITLVLGLTNAAELADGSTIPAYVAHPSPNVLSVVYGGHKLTFDSPAPLQ